MNPTVKALWLADLRSNPPQHDGRLRTVDQKTQVLLGDCCLGRLCEISKLGEWRESRFNIRSNSKTYMVAEGQNETGNNHYLPGPVMTWAGLSDIKAMIPGSDTEEVRNEIFEMIGEDSAVFATQEMLSLASLNDALVPFSKIADVIEKYF